MIITYRVQFIEKKEHSQEIEKAEKVGRLISFHYTGKSDTHDAALLIQADIFSVNTGEYDEMQCFFPRKTPLQIFDRVLNTPRFNTALKYLYLRWFSPVSAHSSSTNERKVLVHILWKELHIRNGAFDIAEWFHAIECPWSWYVMCMELLRKWLPTFSHQLFTQKSPS